jgi:small-conductance mechanosensitive channel
VPGAAVAQEGGAGPDYALWERIASRAEEQIGDPATTNLGLEQIRAQIVDWRARFLEAQNANQARIETLRGQIAALGPPPAEGAVEAPAIAERRRELGEALARLQAPGIAAEEAYRRADGLVREIDRILRDRQADALMRLWPAPVNPANWPAGIAALSLTARDLWTEVAEGWAMPSRRAEFRAALPKSLGLTLLALVLLLRGRRWMLRAAAALEAGRVARGRAVSAFVVSLGQIAVPFAGLLALVEAVRATGLVGLVGDVLLGALPQAGLTVLVALWLGARIFVRGEERFLNLPPDRLAEGRFHVGALGLLLALDALRAAFIAPVDEVEAANAVLAYPLILLSGIALFRIGQLMSAHARSEAGASEAVGFRERMTVLLGRATMAVAVGGPAMGAIGYVAAAAAVVYPAVLSLALLAGLLILQRLIGDLYALAIGADEETARRALVPVLFGFALAILALPVLALIWGARDSDLIEIWARFRDGVVIGGTRIAPTDFVTFALVFALAFMGTRLLQGALQSTVLPRTTLDSGAQKAVVAGVGYVGIIIAALLAFSAAGIDLSSLAIVAGALSVGIGFGLQNIVSNFVSGIILLVERPISEGDWIEVGGISGWVRAISVRSTRIETFDRNFVIVPNSDLVSGRVTNWTRFNLTGRLILPVGVAYGSDTRHVERVLREIAEDHPLVVLNPRPMVVFTGFGDSALNFEIRVILRDVNFRLSVQSEMNHEIARRFREEGIEIPFPQRDVWIRSAAPAARAPAAPPAKGPFPQGDEGALGDPPEPFSDTRTD